MKKSSYDKNHEVPRSELSQLGGGLLYTSNEKSREMIETFYDYGSNGWSLSKHRKFESYKELSKLLSSDSIVYRFISRSLPVIDILDYIESEYVKYRLVKNPGHRRDFRECGLGGLVLYCHGCNLSWDDFLWACTDYDGETEHHYQKDQR